MSVGEGWRGSAQAGKETTAGTGVAATRKLYWREVSLNLAQAPRRHRFAVARRDNVLAQTKGPKVVTGRMSMPLSASECLEVFLMGLKGGVTPTTPGGTNPRLWTFVPGSTALESATIEWHDGAREWEAYGVRANSVRIAGSTEGENILSAELFGLDMAQSTLTGSLTDRVPDFIEGWESKLYLDNYAATPGTTNIPGTLINWDVTISNNLGRGYFADNTQVAGALPVGEFDVSAQFLFAASPAYGLTEFTNWGADTERLARLEFGQNEVIETTYKKFVTLDIPGAWGVVDLGQMYNGMRAYQFTFNGLYDTTNAFMLQARAQNARTSAW